MDSSNNFTKVKFYRQKSVSVGQAVYVSGSIPALGDWDPTKALKLNWSQGHNWYGEIYVQAPIDFEYKYIVAGFDDEEKKEVEWNDGPNSKMSITAKSKNHSQNPSTDIRIMSFNIRYANIEDGPNYWENRKELVANLIKKYGCDFIGIQEALSLQIFDLQNLLPMYKWYGRGRDKSSEQGEAVPIFYLHEKWEIEEGDTFWLSDTPDVEGSKTYGNSLPRICTWARFINKQTGTKFFIYNCHLDHENHNAQRKSALQIKTHLEENIGDAKNVLMMGDFNVTEQDEVLDIAINYRTKLRDSCIIGNKEPRGTFHFWSGKVDGVRIDYILPHEDLKVKDYSIIRDNFKNRFPSDHFPILVQLSPQS
jgi:endonuclease/exonuclease/phosphatase family metal-dependent hydrolase